MGYKTEQEEFWAGEFGTDYIQRNTGPELLASNLGFFAVKRLGAPRRPAVRRVRREHRHESDGCSLLLARAARHRDQRHRGKGTRGLPPENVHQASILDFEPARTWDLVLIKGVLIHMNPDSLPAVYEALHKRRAATCSCASTNPPHGW